MKNIKVGDVWYLNFPYDEEGGRYKDRPGIVLEILKKNMYKVIKCTSNSVKRGTFDYTILNP